MSATTQRIRGASGATRTDAILELTGVNKSYAAQHVLSNVDLRIAEGEFVAIIGFSGSGKTTLISTIAGIVMPDSGEVLLDGRPLIGAGPERGVVFQS
jgi:nitrate/nitrite transport system ATP-binding protein